MIVESPKTKRRLTIKDIAELAGVSKTAVSGILNKKPRVCKAKQEKVLDIVRKYDYVPQISARALSTRRTYQIGYLVSSKVTLGLANSYFGTIQAGVGEACKKHGYQMVASTYDLSSIESFVMPEKLRLRSVDGIVIAGCISKEVLEQIKTLNIPYIIIGGKYDDEVLYLRPDMDPTYLKICEYFADLGHKSICFEGDSEIAGKRFTEAVKTQPIKQVKTILKPQKGNNDFEIGAMHARVWLNIKKADRYTVFLANDQICAGFLCELSKNGVKCPDEISIMSCCDTAFCEWNSLPISAVDSLLEESGTITTELLIEFLEGKKNLNEVKKVLADECRPRGLIIRASTGKVPKN